ncbi:hypothetical protein HPHPP25_1701 [Helicobacter pylori Hp P-25]|nr:hypothetical protein HPHPP25_1701 [Helicobacter pylori Hp P-25]EJC33310.1 hypothetical protein HPHPP25C_1431 [Helicobacter pylori Hp P-25c]EJC38922.1 hypothetical protein HPHPP25D_0602 [Helicobacter pylori Hp P-25d]
MVGIKLKATQRFNLKSRHQVQPILTSDKPKHPLKSVLACFHKDD